MVDYVKIEATKQRRKHRSDVAANISAFKMEIKRRTVVGVLAPMVLRASTNDLPRETTFYIFFLAAAAGMKFFSNFKKQRRWEWRGFAKFKI